MVNSEIHLITTLNNCQYADVKVVNMIENGREDR